MRPPAAVGRRREGWAAPPPPTPLAHALQLQLWLPVLTDPLQETSCPTGARCHHLQTGKAEASALPSALDPNDCESLL